MQKALHLPTDLTNIEKYLILQGFFIIYCGIRDIMIISLWFKERRIPQKW